MRIWALLALVVAFAGCKNDAPPAPATPQSSAPIATAPVASTPTTASAVPTNDPPPASSSCSSDSDCILTTFPGCCACCECGPLKATTKSIDQEARDNCQRKKCDSCDKKDYKCVPCKDPAKEGMHARCRDNACILVETSSAAAPAETIACKTDDDCWLDDKNKPIKRPANLRGKKLEPCKGGHEQTPACKENVCVVRAWKC